MTKAVSLIFIILNFNATSSNCCSGVMAIKQMLEAAEQAPEWNIIMMTTLLAMLPPVLVVIFMQKLFVKGLTETEK